MNNFSPDKKKSFAAVFVVSGRLRRLFFDAANENEALEMCTCLGVGLEGEVARTELANAPLPEAYDQVTARRLLGGVSRSWIYDQLELGYLERMSKTRRLLITRRSIESRCQI